MKIVIIGGGISGLAAAFRLTELKREGKFDGEFTLLEAANRFGGTLRTIEREGFLLEGGADSFLSEKPEAVNLARRLGIENELISTNDENRRAFIVRHGKLCAVPNGFHLIAPANIENFLASDILDEDAKSELLREEFIAPLDEENADESLAEFVRRRFGQTVLERIAQPMIGGIYGANPENLSLKATQPRFLELERKYGSVIRGLQAAESPRQSKAGKSPKSKVQSPKSESVSGARYSLFLSFRKGIQTLVDTLIEQIPENSCHLNSKVSALNFDGNTWQIQVNNAKVFEADAVILAMPAHKIAELLQPQFSELAAEFASVEHASTATINLAFRREQIAHKLDGFGFVVPFIEAKTLMACTFSSVKFTNRAPENCVLVRGFIGGMLQQDKFDLAENEMLEGVLSDLDNLLKINGKPLFTHIEKWANSMPQYNIGHLQKGERIKNYLAEIPTLQIATTAIDGVGLPDSIRHGEQAAENIYEKNK